MQNTRERYGFLGADLLGENLLPISWRTNLIRSLATGSGSKERVGGRTADLSYPTQMPSIAGALSRICWAYVATQGLH